MNIFDLAKLIEDRNVTINISTGNSRQTNYNGATQINHVHQAPARQIDKPRWEYSCTRCGYTSHTRNEFIVQGGYGNRSYLCEPCDRKQLLAERQERARSVIVEPESDPYQIEAPRQEPQVIVIDTKQLAFDARYREMQEAHAAHVASEFEFIERQRASGAYRIDSRQAIDTDQYRVVKPLQAEQHTHAPDPIETDHARSLREEREWMKDLFD